MLSKLLFSAALFLPALALGFAEDNAAKGCKCCGDACACKACKCDDKGCACNTGGKCACEGDCCAKCCG